MDGHGLTCLFKVSPKGEWLIDSSNLINVEVEIDHLGFTLELKAER